MNNSIFGGLDFYIEDRGVIFGVFFTIFAYKIFNIDVESTKIVSKMEIMDRITKKNVKNDIFCRNLPNLKKDFQSVSYIKVKTPEN